MPPSGRSSSSHSSHSHSSSHSRSSSSHSSSSHSGSSYGRTSDMGSLQSSFTGSTMRGFVISRALSNQPHGYHGGIKPTTHYARAHNYTYYPESWVDQETGTQYQAGYYDENGAYYSDVAFRRDNTYANVVATCPYCGNSRRVDWHKGDELKCVSCGAPMEVSTMLDEYTQDPNFTNKSVRSSSSGSSKTILIIVVVFVVFSFFSPILTFFGSIVTAILFGSSNVNTSDSTMPRHSLSALDVYKDTTLYLTLVDTNTYRLAGNSTNYDKKLTWDYSQGFYYDSVSDCYIDYNTDVAPNLWQYWYEDISGSNKYGWMEYEPDGWYIEVSEGEWQKYPGDTDYLWHFEIDPRDFDK